MRTPVIDIEDFASGKWEETQVHPFIRPPEVHWKIETPELITYKESPVVYYEEYCSLPYERYSNLYGHNSSPVPEPYMISLFGLGILLIGLCLTLVNAPNNNKENNE